MGSEKKWIYLSYITATLMLSWVLDKVLKLIAGVANLSNPMFMGVVRTSTVISVVVMSIIAYFYFRRPKVDAFSQDVIQEVKKVTWPPRKNVYMSTIVVVIGVLIVAVILGLYDWLCASLVGLMISS